MQQTIKFFGEKWIVVGGLVPVIFVFLKGLLSEQWPDGTLVGLLVVAYALIVLGIFAWKYRESRPWLEHALKVENMISKLSITEQDALAELVDVGQGRVGNALLDSIGEKTALLKRDFVGYWNINPTLSETITEWASSRSISRS